MGSWAAAAADLLDPPGWAPTGRPPPLPHQRPPDGVGGVDWDLWLLFGGRGAGKTEAGARYICEQARRTPRLRARIIGPSLGDVIESCVRGPSGILALDPDARFLPSHPGGSLIRWPAGSEALLLGTHSPQDVERLRAGGNRHLDWWEELAACRHLEAAWDQAQFGLRLGPTPHSVASTTPRPRKWIRQLIAGDLGVTVAQTHARMDDNPHLDEAWKAKMRGRYEGTRLGRQEIEGQLLTDTPGALWTLEMIDAHRVREAPPELVKVVVGVDPAVTATEDSDETGIITAGVDASGDVFVLADGSCRLSPEGWARRVVDAWDAAEADEVIAEVNNGGDLVVSVIRAVDAAVTVRKVHASRGKQVRAQPVAALYEQGRVHHVGDLVALEDEMSTWVPGESSPDRMDALVWAVTALVLEGGRRRGGGRYRG